jgi:hypothetical protein
MNPDLHNKLLDDLKKSGFASELAVLSILKQDGWMSMGSTSYFDLDEKKIRAIDAHAFKVRINSAKTMQAFLIYQLNVEVKKSERPWIVLRQDADFEDDHDVIGDYQINHGLDQSALKELGAIIAKHTIRENWMGYSVHEAFKEPNETGRWYAAATAVTKATYRKRDEADDDSNSVAGIFHPIVVLDGLLLEAHVEDDGDTHINEIPYAPMHFTFGSEAYKEKTYRIDLVTVAALPRYLQILNARIDAIYALLKKQIEGSAEPVEQ